MDIRFSCPACGHHMVIDEAGAGMVVQCPECGSDADVPKVESKPAPTPKPASDARSENERTVALKWTPPPDAGPKK
jgi:uncharacterized Zn finger protein